MSKRWNRILVAAFVVSAVFPAGGDEAPPTGRKSSARRFGPDPTRKRTPLSQQEQREALEFLRKHRPDQHERVVRLKEIDLETYMWVLRRYWRRAQRLKGMSKEAKAVFLAVHDIRVEIVRLRGALGQAGDEAERKEFKKQIRAAVTKEFGAEQKMLEYRLKGLEAQIKRMRQSLADRARNRKQIIDDRLERLISKAPGGGRG